MLIPVVMGVIKNIETSLQRIYIGCFYALLGEGDEMPMINKGAPWHTISQAMVKDTP